MRRGTLVKENIYVGSVRQRLIRAKKYKTAPFNFSSDTVFEDDKTTYYTTADRAEEIKILLEPELSEQQLKENL